MKSPDGHHEIAGIVHDISQGDTGLRLTEYRITLKPRFTLLPSRQLPHLSATYRAANRRTASTGSWFLPRLITAGV